MVAKPLCPLYKNIIKPLGRAYYPELRYDYTEWNEEMFLEKKELYGMTKWSPRLYQNFSSLCARMMQAIWGYSFFG